MTQIVIDGTQLKFRRRIMKRLGEGGSVVSTKILGGDHRATYWSAIAKRTLPIRALTCCSVFQAAALGLSSTLDHIAETNQNSRMKQASELVDGFYFGEAWMQEFSRYHVMIATAPPKNGESVPPIAETRSVERNPESGDVEEPDFQQKVCHDIRKLLQSNKDYSGRIILSEAVILTGGGDWDVQLTLYVDNKSHELFRRFIRRQLRMLPAVLRTNTVAVSLIPIDKKDTMQADQSACSPS